MKARRQGYYEHQQRKGSPREVMDVASGSTLGGTNSGTITLTFTYSGTTIGTKTFTWSKAITGATGAQGQAGNSAQWYSGTGITGTSTTATVFSGSGVSNAHVGDMYLNTSTQNTYRCTVAGAASAAKWVYVSNIKGATGTSSTNVVCGNEAVSIPSTLGGLVKAASTITIPFLVCDEEGKLKDYEPNRLIPGLDIIAGTFFLAGIDDDDLTDLPENLIRKYEKLFRCPQAFVRSSQGILMIDEDGVHKILI